MTLLLLGLAFAFCLLVGYALLLKGRQMGEKKRVYGREPYACGETLTNEQLAVESDNFYKTFHEALLPAYRFFEKVQNGDLTNYLVIIILVLALVSIIAVVLA